MVIVSIDGACRRNGKPDCLSTGVAFVKQGDTFSTSYVMEMGSTNQRGEIKALIQALKEAKMLQQDIILITDSEYVFNTVKKSWVQNWRNKGWITGSGTPVKNQDLWEEIVVMLDEFEHEIVPFHIKGHLFPFGKVAAADLIKRDPTGEFLYRTIYQRVTSQWDSRQEGIQHALELYRRNNEHEPPLESFVEIIVCNTVSDLMAGYWVEQLDSAWIR